MDKQEDIEHQFDITGLKAGESFLGCPKCWWRLEPGQAIRPVCPVCQNDRLLICYVTKADTGRKQTQVVLP